MEPTPKAPGIDRLLTSLTGINRIEAIKAGACTTCDATMDLTFRDQLSLHEYRISGMCQACQDSVFTDDDDLDDIYTSL